MPLYLGVDGGQSATKVAIGDETGRILGRGVAGPCNHVGADKGREKLEGAIRASVGEALQDAGLPAQAFAFRAACCGMSGGPADKQAILAELLNAEHLEVTTDAHIALWGGTAGEPGVVVIAGTGSIALAENAAGETARAGGWGYIFGDEGGAFDLVRQALRAALKAEEGWGPETRLLRKLLDACGAPDANALLHWFYTADWPRSRVAALAPLVNEAAEEGDPEAQRLLADAGSTLAGLALAVQLQLFPAPQAPPVAMAGGLFHSPGLREGFRKVCGERARDPRHPPA
ncbi:MAG: ATPase, partial [Bryobacterales bacterium]|nr:ATPase [Bryobacterales bacterium]